VLKPNIFGSLTGYEFDPIEVVRTLVTTRHCNRKGVRKNATHRCVRRNHIAHSKKKILVVLRLGRIKNIRMR